MGDLSNVDDVAAVGELFWTPTLLASRISALDAEVRILDRQVQAERTALGASFVEGWGIWLGEWRAFYARYGRDASWLSRVFGGGVADQADRWQAGLERWRAMVQERGVAPAAPASVPVERPTVTGVLGTDPTDLATSVAPIAIAAAVVVGVGGAIYFFGGARR